MQNPRRPSPHAHGRRRPACLGPKQDDTFLVLVEPIGHQMEPCYNTLPVPLASGSIFRGPAFFWVIGGHRGKSHETHAGQRD